jgi:DNA helicase II / ATP-dependent DNA helicase PcrA
MSLNPAQQQAVNTLSGPMLVLAGAGTGKTRVVMHRVVNLIRHRVAPSRILAVTFTNKAAREMQQRAGELLGKRQKEEKPEISTFHSLCVRILRRQIHHLGYPQQFAIYDRGDQESIARAALRDIKVSETTLRPGDLIQMISGWKMAGVDPARAAAVAQSDKQHLGAAAYRRYQKSLKAAGAVDFDDLLGLTGELFTRFPAIRREEAGRFDHLMVDEYQDTNASQYHIVKALAAGHRNLCVVGDDDQSIYGWRGAEVTHILRFKNDWPEAKVVRLETNYRSTREIIDWSNRLIAFNKVRHDKKLRATVSGEKPRILQAKDETVEAELVVGEIKNSVAARRNHYGDFAILFRTNEQPRLFEEQLRRAKVPYVLVGSQSFYDRKEIRDILAYLKLLVHPRDEVSLLRIINTPARGIGQTTITRLVETAVARGKPIWDALGNASDYARMSAAGAKAIGDFRELIERYRKRSKTGSLASVVADLIAEIGYKNELTRLYPNPSDVEARWQSVEEVVNAVGVYCQRESHPTLSGFVQEIAVGDRDDGDDKEARLAGDNVALMTLHSAKGLEFPAVYMVGMEEGVLPHKRSIADTASAIDEERRLCYVGLTRAQRRLTLTMALTRQKWGKPRPTLPSRFLYEITGQADNPKYLESIRGGAVQGKPKSTKGKKPSR